MVHNGAIPRRACKINTSEKGRKQQIRWRNWTNYFIYIFRSRIATSNIILSVFFLHSGWGEGGGSRKSEKLFLMKAFICSMISHFFKVPIVLKIVWNPNNIVNDKWQWYIEFMKQIPKRIINDPLEGWMRPIEMFQELIGFPNTNHLSSFLNFVIWKNAF